MTEIRGYRGYRKILKWDDEDIREGERETVVEGDKITEIA